MSPEADKQRLDRLSSEVQPIPAEMVERVVREALVETRTYFRLTEAERARLRRLPREHPRAA